MKKEELIELKKAAARGRILGISMIHGCNSGHVGGAFSVMDILSVLYFHEMRIDPADPAKADRDRLVLSKGHCTAALYPMLAMRGFFPEEHLSTFRNIDSNLSGHVEMKHIPGVDMSAGSLGQGLSAAVGMAAAGKMDGLDYRVYAIMGDGEIEEGQIWEAAMSAAKFGLDNLVGIVDVNGLQLDGTTQQIMPTAPLADKWRAFGWNVIELDGHDPEQIASALESAKTVKGKPTMLLAKTVKGKGVSFMENQVQWHGHTPSDAEFAAAMQELSETLNQIGA